jgi:hypothetical protein
VVPALDENFDQPLRLESIQMHARRGRTHVSYLGKLGAGSRVLVQQAIQDARSCRFANGGTDSRDSGVLTGNDIHILILDESLKFHKWRSLLERKFGGFVPPPGYAG